ncbi:hypothetical protein K2173_013407 [Erythroxylum novogranatense]|uniref:Uncharacterized protein n=1 Tax=Erythroxylum novogranatense TaxID=1862640 RepID=A0AAV8S4M0_9ROSI|nr:hypothetical protein K2173_013407 [Erythroxylum novogranatense]
MKVSTIHSMTSFPLEEIALSSCEEKETLDLSKKLADPLPALSFFLHSGSENGIICFKLCELLPLQRYVKALSILQRSQLVEKSRQKPQKKMRIWTDVMKSNNYAAEPMLQSCGVKISSRFTQVEGCVLSAPKVVSNQLKKVMMIYSICLLEKRRMKLENGTSNSIDGENGLERVHESGSDMFGFSNPESDKGNKGIKL